MGWLRHSDGRCRSMDMLRHGAIGVPFGGACALSTLGLHLRCYTWGNVTQLEKAGPTRRPQTAAA